MNRVQQQTENTAGQSRPGVTAAPAWLHALSDEDQAFIRRFILASGSLKDVAAAYGVSYPTVRQRLNRVIDKITIYEQSLSATHFERSLRLLMADGRIDAATSRQLLEAYRKDQEKSR